MNVWVRFNLGFYHFGGKIMTEKNVNELIEDILSQRVILIFQAKNVIGNNLLTEDYYFMSIIDRSIRLLDGFAKMLELRNLMCSGILLRSLLDNIMRLFAYFIAADRAELVQVFLNDEKKVSTLKDKDGKNMSDQHLKKKMKILDDRFEDVYNTASGYVHHSGKSLFSITIALENYTIETIIGDDIPLCNDVRLQECAEAFMHYLLLQHDLVARIVLAKEEFDKNMIIAKR
jgi:hypothetical protein